MNSSLPLLAKDDLLQAFNPETGVVVLIDKPLTWTSFDAVNRLKYNLPYKKVGHAGTLDPLATGLLIICAGRMTKRVDEFQALPKEYEGTLVLGAETPSYDLETEVSATYPIEDLTEEQICEAVKSFTGTIQQVPPAYSAVRQGGKRAYKQARAGKEVKLEGREVTIYSYELTRIKLPEVDFRVKCSKGTYIRSLVHDLGKKLHNGAYLKALKRTAIGDFRAEKAFSPNEAVDIIREIHPREQQQKKL